MIRHKFFRHEADCLEIGGNWLKTMLMKKYPEMIWPGFLAPIFKGGSQANVIRLALWFLPANLHWNTQMDWKFRRLQQSIREAESRPGGIARPEEVKALKTLSHLRTQKAYTGTELYDLYGSLTVITSEVGELEKEVNELKKSLLDMELGVDELNQEQKEAVTISGWLPVCKASEQFLKNHSGRIIDHEAAAAFYPFLEGSISDGQGAYAGNRVADGSFVFLDLEEGEGNKNILVVGASGEGKSTFLKALVASLLLEGYRVFVVDVDGEFQQLCDEVGGLWIDQSANSGKYTDPTRIPPKIGMPKEDAARWDATAASLIRIVSLLAGGLDPMETNAADRALQALWNKAGIERGNPETWDNPSGGIQEWYDLLASEESEGANSLKEKLWRYFKGSMRHFFDTEESLDLSGSRLVVFHVASAINKQDDELLSTVKMTMAMDAIWNQVRIEKIKGERYTAVFCDEGQRFLLDQKASVFVNNIATTIRKWNGLMVLATNKPSVLWSDSTEGTIGGSGLWANSAYKVLFWVEESEAKAIEKHAELPDTVIKKMKSLHQSYSYIIRTEKGFDTLRLILPPEELALYKTRGLNN